MVWYSEVDLCDYNFLGSKGHKELVRLKTPKDSVPELAGSVNTELSVAGPRLL